MGRDNDVAHGFHSLSILLRFLMLKPLMDRNLAARVPRAIKVPIGHEAEPVLPAKTS